MVEQGEQLQAEATLVNPVLYNPLCVLSFKKQEEAALSQIGGCVFAKCGVLLKAAPALWHQWSKELGTPREGSALGSYSCSKQAQRKNTVFWQPGWWAVELIAVSVKYI